VGSHEEVNDPGVCPVDGGLYAGPHAVPTARALDVQQEVLNLLIDERVAADTSLMAFLSLSNQIINELDRRIGYKDELIAD